MIVLDSARMGTRREAHEYLKEQLSFPEYYGKNLDALYDCLTDLDETEVQFINQPQEETYFSKVLRVFRDAAEDNSRLHITEAADEYEEAPAEAE